MKKYKKTINKTPLKVKSSSSSSKYIEPIHQIYSQAMLQEELVYEIKTKNENIVNTEAVPDNIRIKKKTLKRKIKSIDKLDKCKRELSKSQTISGSPKKVKRKIVKKKKKKKEIKYDNGSENQKIENGSEVVTPNGNDEMDSFYLIDYQSKNKKNNEGVNEETPDGGEDYYNTFHESNFNQSSNNEKNNETSTNNNEQQNTNNDRQTPKSKEKKIENLKMSNHSISSNSTSKLLNKKNNKMDKKKEEISPLKITFEDKDCDKDQNRPSKMKKIKFREKDNKSISLDNSKEKDKTSDNSKNEYEKEKEKEKKQLLDIEFARKRKKILIKKKQNMKAILIQSVWRMYVMKKIINYYRKILKFISLMNSIKKNKLKTFLLFFFEQIKSLYDNNSVANSKKFKKKRIKLRNILPKNKNSVTEENLDNNNNYNEYIVEDKNVIISTYNNKNYETYNNRVYNRKSFDNNEKRFSLKDSVNSMNDKINYRKEKLITIYKNKKEVSLINEEKEDGSNTTKVKYKYKQFRIEKINKNDNNNNINNHINNDNNNSEEEYLSKSVSLDSKKYLSNKKRAVKSPVIQSIHKKEGDSRIENLFGTHYKSSLSVDYNKNKDDFNSVNDNSRNKRKASYRKKIIGSNSFYVSKYNKNKYAFSLIKFLIKTKEIITRATKKKNFYQIINIFKRKVLLNHIIDNYNNKKRNIMKNIINKYKIKVQVLKYLDKYKQNELVDKKDNMEIFYNDSLFICDKIINDDDKIFSENCIETNELTINSIPNKKRKKMNKFEDNKLKYINNNSSLEINDINLDKNKFILDQNIISFTIGKEIKFNKNKLVIEDKTSNIKINKQNYENKKFIIDKIISKFVINRSYNKEIDFNEKKLIISKTISNYKINNQNNERNIFVINKVVGKFNIKKKNDKHNFIITKLINHSPILNIKKNNNLIITKKVNNLTIKGKVKKKNNYIINKINNNSIIDDINAYREKNKKLYYLSIINNNKQNLINKNISNFNIKSQKKKIWSIENNQLYIQSTKNNNYMINKIVNYNISGNNLLRKYLYKYNENKLVITKVSKNLSLKRQDTNKIKKQILNSTALLKIKSIISKKIQKMIFPKLINIMIKLSFCNLISKFSYNIIKNTKLSLINDMQNKHLEEKYKNLNLNNKYDELMINKIINYNIMNNNEDENNFENNNCEENADNINIKYKRKSLGQMPKHYIVHKSKKNSLDNDEKKVNENNNSKNVETKKVMSNYEKKYLEKLYEKKKNIFLKVNVITKIINLFIGNDKQKNKVVEIEMSRNSTGNVFKNDNRIYISRFKMSKTKNLKENNNINNNSADYNDRTIRQNFNFKNSYKSSYKNSIKNSPIYRIKKSSLKENEDNKYPINIQKGKESNEKQIKEKIGVRANNNEKNMNEMKKVHHRFKRRFVEETDEESEEEESEFEEEEEESEDIEKAKEILIKYILKKHKIMNQMLLNAFNKWKRTKKNFHFLKKVNKNEFNVDIYENGGINKSKKIFFIYRKYNNYSYYMKKILRKWKKISERKKYRLKHEEFDVNEKSEFDEEEIEEVEDEEDETEEEMEKREFRRRKHH